MLIEKGKRYLTKCGNVVELDNTVLVDDEIGAPKRLFYGRVVKAIKGHEILTRKRQIYSESGKWLNEYRQVVPKCIHDLKELFKS